LEHFKNNVKAISSSTNFIRSQPIYHYDALHSSTFVSLQKSPIEYKYVKDLCDYSEIPNYYYEKVPLSQLNTSFEKYSSKDYGSRYDQSNSYTS